jgi:hypothetical protein
MKKFQFKFGAEGQYKLVDLSGKLVIIESESMESAWIEFDKLCHSNHPDYTAEFFQMWLKDGEWIGVITPEPVYKFEKFLSIFDNTENCFAGLPA